MAIDGRSQKLHNCAIQEFMLTINLKNKLNLFFKNKYIYTD